MVRSFIEQSKLKFYKMIKALFYIENKNKKGPINP